MNRPSASAPPPARRGAPEFFAPPPPPLRRPPGRLKLGPSFAGPIETREAIRFRFGTRLIHATASSVDGLHPNVIRLRLQHSALQQLLVALVCCLPSSIQAWLNSTFPEWSLPSQVILKKHKEGWDEEFETEKLAYAKLRPLQGVVVPKCFGELNYNHSRALLLSDIGGGCLATPQGALLEVPELRQKLSQALTALAQFKIIQDDIKLDNFHLVGDKIMVVDLERLREESMSDDQVASDINSTINFPVRIYEDNQYCFWEDGLIVVES